MARPKSPLSLAKWKYNKHKAQSKFRNIPFNITFEDWYKWWLDNGVDKNVNTKWAGNDRPCMCRFNDLGGYELNNIYMASNSQNVKDLSVHIKLGVKAKSPLRMPKLKYRWGDEIVNRQFLLDKGISVDEAYYYFRVEVYDRAKAVESRKLRLRFVEKYGTEHSRVRWEGADGQWFHYALEAAKSLSLGYDKYRSEHKKGVYKKIMLGPNLSDFIIEHSRYPDPILPEKSNLLK